MYRLSSSGIFSTLRKKNGLFYFIPLLKGLKLEPKLIKSVNFFLEFFFHFSGKEKGESFEKYSFLKIVHIINCLPNFDITKLKI
jgi:hypothetical protein